VTVGDAYSMFEIESQEASRTDTAIATGIGVITYQNGERYEGRIDRPGKARRYRGSATGSAPIASPTPRPARSSMPPAAKTTPSVRSDPPAHADPRRTLTHGDAR